jgi:IS605 OrfB family transposase
MEVKNLKTMKIRIKDYQFVSYAKDKLYKTKHFENILLILIHQDYKQNGKKMFKYLTNSSVMRAVISGNIGGKDKEKVEIVREFFKDNQLMKDLLSIGKTLKIHNLVETIKEIKKNYSSFFTKLKNGDTLAKPPKAKKLKKVNHFTLHTDSYKSFTLKKKNKIGINLSDKMRYIHVKHSALEKVVGYLDNIKNIGIHLSNGYVYLLIAYENQSPKVNEKLKYKAASIDIGINVLATLYIEDQDSPSLLIDGTPYKSYNSNFNRFMAKINEEIMTVKTENRMNYLSKYRSFLYEKRNNFFFSEFHKISKRILEYCQKQGVTHLIISKNLAELKNNGEIKLHKKTKQNFIQIPFMQLLKDLIDKAPKYGIIVENVNEAYTSKTSSLSSDIKQIQTLSQTQKPTTNDYKGSRVERGLFKDKVKNMVLHADVNGSRNICYLGFKGNKIPNICLKKICNPFKIKCDREFVGFLTNNKVG